MVDLKKCINNVHTNQPFPGRREDFPDQQAYENWQRREVKQLTELMNTLMLMKPNLALSSTGERDVGSSNMLSGESGRSRNSVPASDSVRDISGIYLYLMLRQSFSAMNKHHLHSFLMIQDLISGC